MAPLAVGRDEQTVVMTVIELSLTGFQARSKLPLSIGAKGDAFIELGTAERSQLQVEVMREHCGEGMSFYGFRVNEADDSWRRCVAALETRHVGDDL